MLSDSVRINFAFCSCYVNHLRSFLLVVRSLSQSSSKIEALMAPRTASRPQLVETGKLQQWLLLKSFVILATSYLNVMINNYGSKTCLFFVIIIFLSVLK